MTITVDAEKRFPYIRSEYQYAALHMYCVRLSDIIFFTPAAVRLSEIRSPYLTPEIQ